jgi:multiple antibiotic resistance protein
MLRIVIAFLVMLNPFALFLYLRPVMKELPHRVFLKVFFKASLISYLIYVVFLLSQDFLFDTVFQIDFEAFRVFGGIIIFSIAYLFIIKGRTAFVHIHGDLDNVVHTIALPLMVGPGTISLTILLSHQTGRTVGVVLLALIMAINFGIVMSQKFIRDNIRKRMMRNAFDKNMEILLRLNGFFLGAIGLNMVFTGINNMYF